MMAVIAPIFGLSHIWLVALCGNLLQIERKIPRIQAKCVLRP